MQHSNTFTKTSATLLFTDSGGQKAEPDFRWGTPLKSQPRAADDPVETARRRAESEIGPGTKTTADAGQHDNAYIRIVIAGAHVFADLGHGAVFLGGVDHCVHPLRPVEFDPKNPVVLGLLE